jgi:hypothetical protein
MCRSGRQERGLPLRQEDRAFSGSIPRSSGCFARGCTLEQCDSSSVYRFSLRARSPALRTRTQPHRRQRRCATNSLERGGSSRPRSDWLTVPCDPSHSLAHTADERAHSVIHHVEADRQPSVMGTDRRRLAILTGDRLILRPVDLPAGVKEWTVEFERVRRRAPTRKP